MSQNTRLGLGGHSFIQELGNDPHASFEEQCAIVTACLDAGLSWIDTTYYQERVGLGRVLAHLGRRSEARITAWNFFCQPGQENALVGFTPYEAHHLQSQLTELQTDSIDLLVIHAHDNQERLQQEMELARQWREEGRVKQVGLGMAQREHIDSLPQHHPFTHVLSPYNAFHLQAADTFHAAKRLGLKTVAMSPFVRGWNLDKIGGDTQAAAQLLLRWVLAQEIVDTVFVSMRRAAWVRANLEAEQRGPLNEAETAQVHQWAARLQ
jgi:aryl-alcohol dehydrogenase-like predicted oxidoreductase